MSDDVVARTDQLLATVVEGPWEIEEYRDHPGAETSYSIPDIERFGEYRNSVDLGCDKALAEFIVRCRNEVVPELRDALVEARVERDQARDDLERMKLPARALLLDHERMQGIVERLTEQLIDARLEAFREKVNRWSLTGPDYDNWAVCLGMQQPEVDAYLADPRGFMRQKITEESRG